MSKENPKQIRIVPITGTKIKGRNKLIAACQRCNRVKQTAKDATEMVLPRLDGKHKGGSSDKCTCSGLEEDGWCRLLHRVATPSEVHEKLCAIDKHCVMPTDDEQLNLFARKKE